jgi:triosephosphate isomerase
LCAWVAMVLPTPSGIPEMRPLIGTSWKMNLTASDADGWFRRLVPRVTGLDECELFVLPPFTSIWLARERLRNTAIAWGAQDVHPDDSGAHTGDVSAAMLADLGCRFVEVGHSERRQAYGETPERIRLKVTAILRWGMRPIICVGEPEPGPVARVMDLLRADLEIILADLTATDWGRLVIAYEPHWAIGEGAASATPGHIGAICAPLSDWLDGRFAGPRPQIIYGGSVDADSAVSILSAGGVDGLFVGRSALDPDRFAAIVRAAAADARSGPHATRTTT